MQLLLHVSLKFGTTKVFKFLENRKVPDLCVMPKLTCVLLRITINCIITQTKAKGFIQYIEHKRS